MKAQNIKLLQAVVDKNLFKFIETLETGVDLNEQVDANISNEIRMVNGRTIFMEIVLNAPTTFLKIVLDNFNTLKFNPNLQSRADFHILHLFFKIHKENTDNFKLLLKYKDKIGLDLNVLSWGGKTPLDEIIEIGDVYKDIRTLLINCGAKTSEELKTSSVRTTKQ